MRHSKLEDGLISGNKKKKTVYQYFRTENGRHTLNIKLEQFTVIYITS